MLQVIFRELTSYVIIRWIDVEDVEVKETFPGFLEVTDPSAQGLCDIIMKYLKELGIGIMKVKGSIMTEHLS